jgi:hypothetical protein
MNRQARQRELAHARAVGNERGREGALAAAGEEWERTVRPGEERGDAFPERYRRRRGRRASPAIEAAPNTPLGPYHATAAGGSTGLARDGRRPHTRRTAPVPPGPAEPRAPALKSTAGVSPAVTEPSRSRGCSAPRARGRRLPFSRAKPQGACSEDLHRRPRGRSASTTTVRPAVARPQLICDVALSSSFPQPFSPAISRAWWLSASSSNGPALSPR